MTTTNEQMTQGTSRRNVLRGAALGTAVLWTVPVVQAVSMTAASAQVASDTRSRLKSNNGNNANSVLGGNSGKGGGVGGGKPVK